ncbi:MAG: OmpA family protein [Syntrophothermus sp.]
MKRFVLICLLVLMIVPYSYSQRSKYIKHHAFSGTLMAGVDGGVTFGFTDYKDTRVDLLGRVVLEYFFPTTSNGIFSLRAFGSTGYVGGQDEGRVPTIFRSEITDIGGGAAVTFSIQEAVFPYVFAGASYKWFKPKDENGNVLKGYTFGFYKHEEENYHLEGGVRFLLSPAINLNFNIGAQFSPHDSWDEVVAGGNNDWMLRIMAGLSYSFFTKTDADGDGVVDNDDACPNTPKGVPVDDAGCPLDSDKDGIPDYLDKCPNTEKGLPVDENGCVKDADQDGVVDNLDRCPNTPKGVRVNEAGCPDTDNDGVFDNEDKCNDTPQGAPVDQNGCPKDSDGDGVPDYKDECPNTPKNVQVDAKGCHTDTVKVEVTKEFLLAGDTNFEYNKATLLPAAYDQLNKLADYLKRNPNTRWRIEGHTDSDGSNDYNMELSRKRAQAVADYLTGKGIQSNRLEVIPLGETQPKADNKTQEGKAMNRRVEVKLIE